MGHCKKNEEKASEQEHKKHRSALRALKKEEILTKTKELKTTLFKPAERSFAAKYPYFINVSGNILLGKTHTCKNYHLSTMSAKK